MRTALFIYESSTVTIRALDPRDASVEICRYNALGEPALGARQLEPGIYLIVSASPLAIEGVRGDVETMRNNKDEWPLPKLQAIALERGASAASVQEFLTVAKDISPGD